jgi:hypothetical protein
MKYVFETKAYVGFDFHFQQGSLTATAWCLVRGIKER